MKRTIFLALFVASSLLLTGCEADKGSQYPYLEYINSGYNFDDQNQLIDLPEGYILNQGHSYDVVETDAGYDVIVHLIKDQK